MGIELYTQFFGFSERPFTLLPDPDFLYWSPAHRRAYLVLEYGILTHAPLTVITGEIGAGKTTLVQHLLANLPKDVFVGLISNAQGGRGDLLRWVLYALGIDTTPDADYVSMFRLFQDFIIEEYARGGSVVLVIDEAQNLSLEALEELRMFTNINSNKYELLQLILVGQPELRQHIASPALRQFAQRVSATYHLEKLTEASTQEYIKHRLVHAGGTGEEISPEACARIHTESQGTPRLINKLCDIALVYAAGIEYRSVDVQLIEELLADGLFINPDKVEEDVFVLENPVSSSQKTVK